MILMRDIITLNKVRYSFFFFTAELEITKIGTYSMQNRK
jgi:hypothetical protein